MGSSTTKRILVVDDDPGFIKVASSALEANGYRVTTAADGREALASLHREGAPDLILLDLLMPGMDGWQFREAQLKDPAFASIPTVVITAVSQEYVKAGYLPGVLVLPKPFDVPQLLALVEAQTR
jgi:CheY-like chemotaxis protein